MLANERVIKVDKKLVFLIICMLILELFLLMLLFYNNNIVFLLLLCGPLLFLAIVKRPFIGLFVLTIIAFLNFGLWTSPLIIRIVTMVTLVSFSIKMIVNDEKIIGSKQLLFLTLFGVVAFLSFFSSRDMSLWGKGMIRLFSVFLFFIFIINLIKTEKQLWIIIKAIVISVSIGAIYGIYLFRKAGFLGVLVSTGNLVRGGSFIPDANVWAVSLLVAFPLTIAVLIKENNKIIKVFLSFLITIQMFSIFATFSRGGIVAFSIIIVIIVFKLTKKRLLSVTIFLMLCFVAYFVLPPFVILRVKTLLSLFQQNPLQDYSLMGRLYLMKAAFKMFIKNPILGVGLFNFIANSGFYCLSSLHKVSHSIYLEILTGTGLLGFIPFMAVFYYSFRDFIASRRNFIDKGEKNLSELSFYASLSLLGVSIAGFFLSIEFSRPLWFLLSFSVVLGELSGRSRTENVCKRFSSPRL